MGEEERETGVKSYYITLSSCCGWHEFEMNLTEGQAMAFGELEKLSESKEYCSLKIEEEKPTHWRGDK